MAKHNTDYDVNKERIYKFFLTCYVGERIRTWYVPFLFFSFG